MKKKPDWEEYLMHWASRHIEDLAQGRIVKANPRGNSMEPKIHSGDTCTIEPVGMTTIEKDMIVLCKVRGNVYLHLVKAIKDSQYQIGNNKSRINGWISKDAIYGICTKIE